MTPAMHRLARRTLSYLLAGTLMNLAVAWTCAAIRGGVPFEWTPYHNPRSGSPIAFFAVRHFGVEWVVGCGRPGTLVDRYPDSVKTYPGPPWWPPEAVTFDDRDMALAAGWPLPAVYAWRTVAIEVSDDKETITVHRIPHWGVMLTDTNKSGWEELPAILPLHPMWRGLVVNTLLYAMAFAATSHMWSAVRCWRRRRMALCEMCAYPRVSSGPCPECGHRCPPLR